MVEVNNAYIISPFDKEVFEHVHANTTPHETVMMEMFMMPVYENEKGEIFQPGFFLTDIRGQQRYKVPAGRKVEDGVYLINGEVCDAIKCTTLHGYGADVLASPFLDEVFKCIRPEAFKAPNVFFYVRTVVNGFYPNTAFHKGETTLFVRRPKAEEVIVAN